MIRFGIKLAVGVLALGLAPTTLFTVGAQPAPAAPPVTQRSSQILLFAQTYDGNLTRSHNRIAGVAEARQEDARWIVLDYGTGSVVERGNGKIAGANVANESAAELGLVFDPVSGSLSGDPFIAPIFNSYLRPLLDRVPQQADSWTLRFTPAEVGIADTASGAVTIRFARRPISHAGRSLTLVEYDVPGFALNSEVGGVAQWGRGGVLIDTVSGALLWSGSDHRAVAQENGAARPYRAQFGAVAVDDKGTPLADPKAISELAELLDAINGEEARAALPFAGDDSGRVPQFPLHLAAVIDLLAIAATQNGIEGNSAAFAGFLLGRTGSNRATVPAAAARGGSQ